MAFPRRRLLPLAAASASAAFLPLFASAQPYPTRPVRILVGFGPGGAPDILARLIAQWLSEHLGQQFLVENRPGASSSVATEAVAHGAPDGYTLLLASMANAVNSTLYRDLRYDFLRDLAPVAALTREPLALEVHPSFPATSVPELIAFAKANPGKISYASAGSGTSLHLAAELFKVMAQVEMVHVPYRSSAPALVDLLGGQVQMLFCPLPSSIEYVRQGKLRALATTGAVRAEALPDTPLVGDFLPGYEASAWYGVCAPRNTAADIVDNLSRKINACLGDPKVQSRLVTLGATPFIASPAEFGKYLAEQTEKWQRVAKAANLKPE